MVVAAAALESMRRKLPEKPTYQYFTEHLCYGSGVDSFVMKVASCTCGGVEPHTLCHSLLGEPFDLEGLDFLHGSTNYDQVH